MGVDGLVHETSLSRWWRVGVVLSGALTAAAFGAALARGIEVWWLVSAAVLAAGGYLLGWAEGRVATRVTASADGLEVAARDRYDLVGWEDVRRARSIGGLGTPPLDTHLERADGRLVRLPAHVPAGSVEVWRQVCGGARPSLSLPQVWLLTKQESAGGVRSSVTALVPSLCFPLVNAFTDFSPATIVPGAALAGLAALVLTVLLPDAQVRADAEGLTYGAFGRGRVAWAAVRDVRAQDRWDPAAVLERTDGTIVKLGGPPVDVVLGWRQLVPG